MKMERAIALFLDYCRSKELRPKTMHAYEQALRLFTIWMREEEGIIFSIIKNNIFLHFNQAGEEIEIKERETIHPAGQNRRQKPT